MAFSYKFVLVGFISFSFGMNLSYASTQFDDIDRHIRLRQYQKAAQLLQPLIKQNNAKAEFMLAGFYRTGRGVKKSLKTSQIFYEKAAQHGSAKAQYTLATLLSKKPPSKKNQKTVLYWYQQSAAQGYVLAQKKLKRLVSRQGSNKNISDSDVFSLIRTNNYPAILALIESGVSFNIKDSQSRIPLQVALLAKNEKMAKSVLSVTSHKNINSCKSNFPLHLAISNGFDEIARYLINKNLQVNDLDLQGNNALVVATRRNNLPIIKLLLKHKGNPLQINNSQSSAVQLAQTLGYQSIVDEFKRNGFKPKAKKIVSIENKIEGFQQQIASQKSLYKGWPLINVASLLGDAEMVLYLLKSTSQTLQKDDNNMSALHRASASGQLDVVKMLVDNKFAVNDLNKKHQTPLFLASQAGHLKVVRYLLKKQADSSIYSSNKSTALAEALAHEHFKTAALLVSYETNQKIIKNAVFIAIKLKQQKLSISLIQKLKQKDAVDQYRRNLLWHAVNNNLIKVSDLLLSVDEGLIHTSDKNGYSPLAQSIKKGGGEISLKLIAKKAPLNIVTKEKNTLLMLATLTDNKTIVIELLKQKVNLDRKNNSGNTALMIAAKNGFNSIIEKLLTAGANSKLRDNNDKNAYQIAVEAKQVESAQLIRQSDQLFQIFN